jgi:hypothetical protein
MPLRPTLAQRLHALASARQESLPTARLYIPLKNNLAVSLRVWVGEQNQLLQNMPIGLGFLGPDSDTFFVRSPNPSSRYGPPFALVR